MSKDNILLLKEVFSVHSIITSAKEDMFLSFVYFVC